MVKEAGATMPMLLNSIPLKQEKKRSHPKPAAMPRFSERQSVHSAKATLFHLGTYNGPYIHLPVRNGVKMDSWLTVYECTTTLGSVFRDHAMRKTAIHRHFLLLLLLKVRAGISYGSFQPLSFCFNQFQVGKASS